MDARKLAALIADLLENDKAQPHYTAEASGDKVYVTALTYGYPTYIVTVESR